MIKNNQGNNKYLILLSAGLDSTVNLYAALHQGAEIFALTFDYGQRAALREIEKTKALCEKLNISHKIISLPFFKDWGGSSLTEETKEIPIGNEVSINDLKVSYKTARRVWVPNRNGVFINVAAGLAESLEISWIVPGFNKEEALTFPDNSREYLDVLNQSLFYSTSSENPVQIKSFTVNMDKSQIVKWGQELNVEWSLLWPCYFAGVKWCGQCESCQRTIHALKENGVSIQNLVM